MHTKFGSIKGKVGSVVWSLILLVSWASPAHAVIVFQDDTVGTYESETLKIGSNDVGASNTAIQFGSDVTASENGNITWNVASNTFGIDHTVNVTGGLSATGQVNFSGASGTRIREVANHATASCATVGELVLNTTSNQIYACTVIGSPGTWTSTASAGQDLESVYNTDTDKVLTTTNNAFTVNTGTNDFIVTSNDWSMSAAGLLTTSGGASFSGGAVNMNVNSNQSTNINTGTSTGSVTIGGGSGTVAIDSSAWDITTTGVASGFTGLTSTGQVNFSGASGTRIREVANQLVASCAAVGELVFNTTDSKIYACTVVGAPGTWSNTGSATTPDFEGVYTQDADKILTTTNGAFTIAAGTGAVNVNSTTGGISLNNNVNGDVSIATGTSTGTVTLGGTGAQTIAVGNGGGVKTVNIGSTITTSTTTILSGSGGLNLNASNNQPTNIGTGTSTGLVSIGGGSGTVAIDSSDWDISATGTMTGIGAITMDGLLTGTAGATLSGAAISLNSSSNFATNIGTGTTTGTVSIGGNSNNVSIDSSVWDITGAGVASGFTGFTSTGPIDLSGASSFLIPQGAADPGTCAVGQQFFNTTSNQLKVCTAVNTWSIAGPQDFEAVYAYDADKVLTTANGAFTIAAGSGAVAVNSTNAAGITLNGSINGSVNIATGTSTGTVTVGGTGAQTIAVGNGAGAKTVALGSSNTTSTTTILSGSGALNMNVSNNQISNLNTGTSTGQVNVGGNANCVNVDSNTWDISCAGLATGFTGLTSTGNINLTGATSFRMPQAAADPGTCNVGQEYYNTTSNTVRLCTSTNTWSNIAASGNAFVFAYDTTTQTTAVVGTFQDVTYSTNAQIDGWTHTGGTATFVSTSAGTYMVNMTARIAKSGGANTTLSFIGVKNTTGAPGTFTEITGSQSYGSAAASTGDTMSGNFIVTMAAGETLKIRMTGGTTGAQIVPGGDGTVLPSTQLSIWRMK